MDCRRDTHQCIIPSLGRPGFELGTLYNLPGEELITGLTLWDKTTLDSATGHRRQKNFGCVFDVISCDTMEEKESSFGIDGSTSLSILCNLIKLDGAAKFLTRTKASGNVANVILRYRVTSYFDQLSMERLMNIQYPRYLERTSATHIVTGIEYGAEAYFVFERKLKSSENRKEVEGNIKAKINLPNQFTGKAGSNLTHSDDENLESFNCRFYGDFVPEKNPSCYSDAVKLYNKLPDLLGEEYANTVPKVIHLTPLAALGHKDPVDLVVQRISSSIVQQAHHLLDSYDSLEECITNLKENEVVKKFGDLQSHLCQFKAILSCLKDGFLKSLGSLLTKVRKGECSESVIADLVDKSMSKSPVSFQFLSAWMDFKKQEVKQLEQFLNMVLDSKSIQHAFGTGEFNLFMMDPEHETPFVSLHFNVTAKDDPILDCFEKILKSNQLSISAAETPKLQSWSQDQESCWKLRQKTTQFKKLVSANEGRQIRFVVTDSPRDELGESVAGLMLCVYGDGILKSSAEIDPPGPPGKPMPVEGSAKRSAKLKWEKSKEGSRTPVTGYIVLYRALESTDSEDGSWKTMHTETNAVTVSSLCSGSHYVFKVVPNCGYFLGEESAISDAIQISGEHARETRATALRCLRIQHKESAASSTEKYRSGYPGKRDDPGINQNHEFYTNRRKSEPKGDFVDTIHTNWRGNYELLQNHDNYTQWLFPTRGSVGVNTSAKELQLHEVEKIKSDPAAMERLIKSYEMMLDFFGLQLMDRKTGAVARSDNWEARFRNLNLHSKNHLRISRMLESIGEFGLEHYQVQMMRHLLREILVEGTLNKCMESCFHYWIEIVRDDNEREKLHRYAIDLAQQKKK